MDAQKFAYFALSMLWRAAVHSWVLPDGTVTSRVDLKHREELIRKYLLSEAPFPVDVIVIVTVCTDWVSRNAFFTPARVVDNPQETYALLTQGVFFRVLMEGNLTPDMRHLCCASSQHKWIFSGSCEDKTIEAFAPMIATGQAAPGLQ